MESCARHPHGRQACGTERKIKHACMVSSSKILACAGGDEQTRVDDVDVANVDCLQEEASKVDAKRSRETGETKNERRRRRV